MGLFSSSKTNTVDNRVIDAADSSVTAGGDIGLTGQSAVDLSATLGQTVINLETLVQETEAVRVQEASTSYQTLVGGASELITSATDFATSAKDSFTEGQTNITDLFTKLGDVFKDTISGITKTVDATVASSERISSSTISGAKAIGESGLQSAQAFQATAMGQASDTVKKFYTIAIVVAVLGGVFLVSRTK